VTKVAKAPRREDARDRRRVSGKGMSQFVINAGARNHFCRNSVSTAASIMGPLQSADLREPAIWRYIE
jgi:hypothetical protein